MRTLNLNGYDLTPEDVVAVSGAKAGEFSVRLSTEALSAVQHSRKIVEDVLASGKTVYGVNTGFGALSQISIPPEQVDQLQINLVRSHAVGAGPELPTDAVRAMLLLRANTLAKGFSGVRPVVITTLLELLNKGVVPVIPSQGSLGASGDLAPLAHLALVLIGEGEAVYAGEKLPGAEALRKAGITPLVLKAKEGLALLNGTQMMTAIGILNLIRAEKLMDLAELSGAMTIEALQGSHRPFDARVAEVRPHSGHMQSAALISRLLANSKIMESHAHCHRVQDAYSLRCIPQVHGAVRDALAYGRRVLTVEINSATDNPLIFPDGSVISQGNFHGEPVAMALDMMSIAMAELASIAERRIDKLMNPNFSVLPAFLVKQKEDAGLHSGLMILHYTAAALVSENKILAHPACVDSIPTSNDKEDHVSMGATAARKFERIVDHARWVIAAELFAAAQALDFFEDLKPGDGVVAAHRAIRKEIAGVGPDRSLTHEIEKLAGLMDAGIIWQAAERTIKPGF